jgi:predicted acetyltransferase
VVSQRILDRRLYSYALVSNNKVIANASANIIDLIWQGEPRRYIQIGTVMTDIDHRNKGLAGQLVRQILADWQDKADAFFLFANPTTVDFYPKFGFERTDEHQYIMPVVPAAGDFPQARYGPAGRRCAITAVLSKIESVFTAAGAG